MNQKKKNSLLIAVCVAMVFAACGKKPVVKVQAQRLILKKISLKELVVDMRYEITNPHKVAITVKKVDQVFTLDGAKAAEGKLVDEIKIPAGESRNIDVRMNVKLGKSFNNTARLLSGGELPYSLKADIEMKTIIGTEKRKLLREGSFRLPIAIGKQPVRIKNIALSGDKLKLEIVVAVPLPRKQKMSTTWAKYSFTIEDSVITEGKVKLESDGTKDFQDVTIPISWPMNKGLSWGPKLLTTGVKTRFKLNFDMGSETEFVIDHKDKIGVNKLKNLIPGI